MRAVVLLVLSLTICSVSPVFASTNIMDVDEESVLWNLDGSGVVIAVADTGIDLDHSCFRNSSIEVGTPGPEHRKVVHLNDSIDDWDTQGHQQFRHGTHIAGILACDQLDGDSSMRSLSHGAKLVVQDVVDSSGWSVPDDVTSLLAESSRHGAVINSWSWGDNTADYTERSGMIDKWTVENPWSLVFIAPGNTGSTMLEPSNAYNAVAVVASDSNENGSLWSGNSHGPDVNDRRGVFIAAPGMSVVSAKADGTRNGMNNESYAMTGTSMATPMAASFTALLQ
ncbi:MAG: S8 family serine peptidase, partial [Candidatus Poseidoniaceae archaeon]